MRALLADRLQDKASRDSQLRRISTYPARSRIFQGRTPLAKLFIQHMDTPTELRKAVLAFLAEKQPEGIFPAEAEFSLAFYLQTRGMKDLAIEHYSNAARVPARDPYRVLAWHFLRKEGIDPVQLPGRNHQSALEPAKKRAPGTNP